MDALLSLTSVLGASLETGLIFAILAIGVVITYKILRISDLTVEGSFPLGAFIFAKFVTMGLDPVSSTLLAFAAGLVAGFITYLIYKKLKVDSLLAGILTMTILYSVNLTILNKANVPLNAYKSVFSLLGFVKPVIILIVFIIILKIIMDSFFDTEQGFLLFVTGDNEALVKALGENPDKFTMLGLMLSNGLIALSGALMGQYQGFADSQMGATMIVTGLASIIIGDTFMKSSDKLRMTTRAIIGAILYRIMIGIALHAGLNPNYLKAATAIIVIIFIAYNNHKETKAINKKVGAKNA
ncbi:MAG: ABC transporter permease [Finegoldia sp.]|nr:ABC transporter permease [Finegoldia sp.]